MFAFILIFLAYLLLGGFLYGAGLYPGESATLAVQHLGLYPRLSVLHPLWGGYLWLIDKIPVGNTAFRLNAASGLCGALALSVFYSLFRRYIQYLVPPGEPYRRSSAIIGSATATIFLAFCVPFWVVSTRVHYAAFDLLLFVYCFHFLLSFAERGRKRDLFLFAFLFAVGIVEYPAIILFSPLAGLAVLYLLYKHKLFSVAAVMQAIAAGCVGLSLYFAVALSYYGSEGYNLRDIQGYLHIIPGILRDQYASIRAGIPTQGWLLVLLLTAVPWLTVLNLAPRALNDERDKTFHLVHGVLSLVALMVLFNVRFAPWPLFGFERMMVTPYLLAAFVYGYLAAYWFRIPLGWWADTENVKLIRARACFAWMMPVPFLLLALFAAFRNFREADTRPAEFVNVCAEKMLDIVAETSAPSAKSPAIILTDSSMDSHIIFQAREKRCAVRLITVPIGGNAIYRKYVSTMFDDPVLKNLATAEITSMLSGWLRADPEAAKRLFVQSPQALWDMLGVESVPYKLLFLSVMNGVEKDPCRLLEAHKAFWASVSVYMRDNNMSSPAVRASRHLARHASMVANNLGVYSEDLGDTNTAFQAYLLSREIYPGNISAVANLDQLIQSGYHAEEADGIRESVELLKQKTGDKMNPVALSMNYGTVRSSSFLTQIGLQQSARGEQGVAAENIERAVELSSADDSDSRDVSYADALVLNRQYQKGENIYRRLIGKNPGNIHALLGMVRIELGKNKIAEASAWLEKAEKAGAAGESLVLEKANIGVMTGNPDAIVSELATLLKKDPENERACILLVDAYRMLKDAVSLERLIGELRTTRMPARTMVYAAGYHAILSGNTGAAVSQLESAYALGMRSPALVKTLAHLNMQAGNTKKAMEWAGVLLRDDPDDAVGLYIVALFQLSEGEKSLAEQAMRKSLGRERTSYALNDLAWILQNKGELDEAEKLVRECLAKTPDSADAWDTLGIIQMKKGVLDDAQKSFEKVLSLRAKTPIDLLHQAELQLLRSNIRGAREIIGSIDGKNAGWSPDDQKLFEELKNKIGR